MGERLPSLLDPPVAFAHRGGRAHAAENTLEAFRLALRLGATGLESDVWLTADSVAVLHHDGRVRSGRRGRPIAALRREELPPEVPALEDLYGACGTGYQLSLDIKEPAAAAAVVEAAKAAGAGALEHLWMCDTDWERLATWRELSDRVRLVCTTSRRLMKEGPERRAAQLAEAEVDAINLHQTEWTGGLTTLFHRFERLALAWDAQHERILTGLLAMGIDAVYSDHVDRMVEALGLVP